MTINSLIPLFQWRNGYMILLKQNSRRTPTEPDIGLINKIFHIPTYMTISIEQEKDTTKIERRQSTV
jgi:hypothetical protein